MTFDKCSFLQLLKGVEIVYSFVFCPRFEVSHMHGRSIS